MQFLHQLLYREATIFAFSCYCFFFFGGGESAAQTRIGLLPAIPRACILSLHNLHNLQILELHINNTNNNKNQFVNPLR